MSQTLRRIGFESRDPVAVSQVARYKWQLIYRMIYWDGHRIWEVPEHQDTDGASVPRLLQWLVSSTTGIAAAILHDYLYRVCVLTGQLTYREADAILRQALLTLGEPAPTAWLMWAAVRWRALFRPGEWRDWWRDAPAVLAVTIVGLPLVLPSVLLLPSLAVLAGLNALADTFKDSTTSS